MEVSGVVNVVKKNTDIFFFSSRRRHTRFKCDWSSDVCSSDLCRMDTMPAGGNRIDGHDLVALKGRGQLAQRGVGAFAQLFRSEERRVGKECRSRWSPYH